MHDPRLLREQPDLLRTALRRRGNAELLAVLDRAEVTERERRAAIQGEESKRAEQHALSAAVREGKQRGEPVQGLIDKSRALGGDIAEWEQKRRGAEETLRGLVLELPNITLPEVPEGGPESNQVQGEWGTPRKTDGVRPHWEIATALGILDLPRGAKVAGSGFVVLRDAGSRLVRALLSLMLEMHTKAHGYEEVWVPFAVNRASMVGTGQFPKFADEQYAVQDEDLFLVPTAEVPVTNLYRDEIVEAAWLPHGFVTYTPCFRREAGAAGKDTRGLLRMHQFDKVELVRLAAPEQSAAEHERMTNDAEAVLRALELPYRRVLLAAGDTGFASAKTYDLEVWAPGVGQWLEVSSSSTFTDFQARRANIRYRPAPGQPPRFVHTLNASGVAIPRTLAAILEQHQGADGSIRIPEALRDYLGADRLG